MSPYAKIMYWSVCDAYVVPKLICKDCLSNVRLSDMSSGYDKLKIVGEVVDVKNLL